MIIFYENSILIVKQKMTMRYDHYKRDFSLLRITEYEYPSYSEGVVSRAVSAVADKQFPDADTRGKSAEEPLRGITPPALTQSGSEAYLARTHSGLQPDVEEDRRGIYVPGRRRIWSFKSIRPVDGKLD